MLKLEEVKQRENDAEETRRRKREKYHILRVDMANAVRSSKPKLDKDVLSLHSAHVQAIVPVHAGRDLPKLPKTTISTSYPRLYRSTRHPRLHTRTSSPK